jgi:hypothetical protein
MARPSKALLKFAELYVNGPAHVQGQWEVCANAAGMREAPLRSDPMVRRIVMEQGGVVLEQDQPPQKPLDQLEQLLAKHDEGIPWKQIRSKLTEVIEAVANGTVLARASQVSMLQFVIKKAEEAAKDESVVHNVIVLPTQGQAHEMKIDDKWLQKIKDMETPNEE